MARDFRHGHQQSANKSGFQRKSQAEAHKNHSGRSVLPMMWAGGFFVSAVLLIGFFISQQMTVSSEQKIASAVVKVAEPVKAETVKDVVYEASVKEPIKEVIKAVEVVVEETEKPEQKPVYSFYEGLSKMEVVVDAEPLSVELKQPLYIQAGTFGSRKVAEYEKSRLAKLGQEMELSTYTTEVRTYYRLRVGPFTDRLIMNKRRNELRRLGVDTLLVRMSKS